MRIKTISAWAIAASLVTGCGKPTPSANATSNDDPLAGFQKIAKSCRDALAPGRPEKIWRVESNGRWMRAVYSPYTVKYDARKTDSLVSPVVAVIEISSQTALLTRDSEAEVIAAEIDQPGPVDMLTSDTHVINFALQEKRWKVQSFSEGSHTTAAGGITVAPITITEESLLKALPAATACLPPR